MENYIRKEDLADLLDCSRSTVYRWVKDNELPTLGAYVERKHLIQWLREQQKEEHQRWQERIDRLRVA